MRQTTLDSAAANPADTELDGDALALHRVVSELVRVFQFRDRDRICCYDISVTQCYALEALVAAGEQTLNQLASALFLDKSTASRVVDALVAKGYAERRPHPQDARAVELTATTAGRRLYLRIDGELLLEVRGVAGTFSPAVRRSIAEMLGQLLRVAAPRLGAGGGCCPPAASPGSSQELVQVSARIAAEPKPAARARRKTGPLSGVTGKS